MSLRSIHRGLIPNNNPIVELATPDLLSLNDKISLYNIITGIELLSLCSDKNSDDRRQIIYEKLSGVDINDKILKILGQIYYEDAIRELTHYVFRAEALTRQTAEIHLKQEWRTLYRSLNKLTKFGLLTPYLPMRNRHSRGRNTTLYHIPNANPETIQKTIQLDKKLKNKLYQTACKYTQVILDRYPSINNSQGGITKRQILEYMQRANLPQRGNTIELVCDILTEKKIQVWRWKHGR